MVRAITHYKKPPKKECISNLWRFTMKYFQLLFITEYHYINLVKQDYLHSTRPNGFEVSFSSSHAADQYDESEYSWLLKNARLIF